MAGNFLSDLGRQSTSHHAVFNGSLIFLGISLIPSFGILWLINTNRMWSMKVTAVFGIISAFGLIGLGLTSVDREFVLHHVALAIWLFPMMYMTVTFFFCGLPKPLHRHRVCRRKSGDGSCHDRYIITN